MLLFYLLSDSEKTKKENSNLKFKLKYELKIQISLHKRFPHTKPTLHSMRQPAL